MTTDISNSATRLADRFLKARSESFMGINVSSFSDRFLSKQDIIDSWWLDLEKLINQYWSLQKVKSGQSSSNLMWFQIYGVNGPMEVQFLGSPERGMKVSIVGEDQKNFGPDASLKDMLFWVDKADRSRR